MSACRPLPKRIELREATGGEMRPARGSDLLAVFQGIGRIELTKSSRGPSFGWVA